MATLKISDLSVGDWVRCGQRNGCIQRIAMHDGETVEVIIKVDCVRLYMYKRVDEIDSIPITPEILEANGFERDPKYGRFYCSESQLEVAFENGEWIHIISHFEYPIHTISGVHHIQHLLRLYGCEKEINL